MDVLKIDCKWEKKEEGRPAGSQLETKNTIFEMMSALEGINRLDEMED